MRFTNIVDWMWLMEMEMKNKCDKFVLFFTFDRFLLKWELRNVSGKLRIALDAINALRFTATNIYCYE